MTTPQLSVPTTAGDGQSGAGGEVAEVGSSRLDAGVVSASAANSPPPAPPFTDAEFDSIVGTIWGDLEEDPFRVGDLLADALGFIAGVALHPDTDPRDAARAAAVLRQMEQRALWGPDLEQEDHR